MNRKSVIFFSAMSLLMPAVQPFFNKLGGLWGVAPDMAAALCAAMAPAAGFWSLAYAAAMGFLCDVQMGSAFLEHTLFYMLTALWCARGARTQKNAVLTAVAAGAACAAARWFLRIVIAFARGYTVDFYAGLLKSMLPQVVLTALAAMLLTAAVLKLTKSALLRVREGAVKYR